MIQPIDYKGRFRLPHSEKWINGSLKYSIETDAILELHGTFNLGIFNHDLQKIIIGETDKGNVTLIECRYVNKRINNRNDVVTGTYKPNIILVNHIFEDFEEIKFREVKFSVFNLLQWLQVSGITEILEKKLCVGLKYNKPQDINFIFKNVTAKIEFDCPIYYDKILDFNSIVEERCQVVFNFPEKLHFDEILVLVRRFTDLITFFSNEQCYPLYINFIDEDYTITDRRDTYKKSIKCIMKSFLYSKNSIADAHYSGIIKYNETQDNFSTIVNNWYSRYVELEPVFEYLMLSYRETNSVLNSYFLFMVQAIETYHRRTHNNKCIDETEYNSKVQNIIQAIQSEDEKKWFSDMVKYSNEPNLRKRLKELFKENLFLVQNKKNRDSLIHKVCESRNYYTHFDKSKEI